jgi:hypothetical protein
MLKIIQKLIENPSLHLSENPLSHKKSPHPNSHSLIWPILFLEILETFYLKIPMANDKTHSAKQIKRTLEKLKIEINFTIE